MVLDHGKYIVVWQHAASRENHAREALAVCLEIGPLE
jgi:hypothetical protein